MTFVTLIEYITYTQLLSKSLLIIVGNFTSEGIITN